jgi:adenine-specific DNA-methyltransferase
MPELQWNGKDAILNHHHSVPIRTLELDEQNSHPKGIEHTLDDNLVITGDNLDAMKALLPKYAGKVDVIYIDPPYNTGNEGWVYNDNVNSPMIKDWLGKAVGNDDLQRHDKWLCMMYPRLQLMKQLLKMGGVIFVSIDDNEVHHLRSVMDEIFGEHNYVGTITWESKTQPHNTGDSAENLQTKCEYILCYTNGVKQTFNRESLKEKEYPEEDEKGVFRLEKMNPKSNLGTYYRPTMVFDNGSPLPQNMRWQISEETFLSYQKRNDVTYKNNGSYLKIRPEDEHAFKYAPFWSHLFDKEAYGTAKSGLSELKGLFPEGLPVPFETVKPTKLLSKLLFHIKNKNALILDPFAGSASTFHAMLQANQNDNGNRKIIMIEQMEYSQCLTQERTKRVIDGVETAKDAQVQAGLGGSFTAVTLGQAMHLQELATLPESELPPRDALASWVFYNTTLQALPKVVAPNATHCIGETDTHTVHLLYEANLAFLRSSAGAFTLGLAERIAEQANGNGKEAIVYAPMSFVDVKTIRQNKWKIRYCNLPYELLQVEAVKPPSTEAIM